MFTQEFIQTIIDNNYIPKSTNIKPNNKEKKKKKKPHEIMDLEVRLNTSAYYTNSFTNSRKENLR